MPGTSAIISKILKLRQTEVQLIRYGLVGLASNSVGYVIYLLITYSGMEPKRTMTLLYMVGTIIGYFGHRQITFAHRGGFRTSGARYLVAHCVGYLLNFMILFTFVDIAGYSHQWVQAAAVFIVAGFLFLTFKFFVFPEFRDVQGRQ